MAGEGVLELCDVLLQADYLGPEPVAFTGELDDPFGQFGGGVVTAQRITAFAFSSAVGAHSFRVVGPFAWATWTSLVGHVNHCRTCVY